MHIYIQKANAVPEILVSGEQIRAYRKANRVTIHEMALRLNLHNRSSLLQYECGSKPLSKKVLRQFGRLTKVSTINGALFTTEKLPGNGTMEIALMIDGEIKQCPCGVWFVTAYSQKVHHSRVCQLHDWRLKRKARLDKQI